MVQYILSVVFFVVDISKKSCSSREIAELVEGVGSGTGAAGAEGLRRFSISSWMRDYIEEVGAV